MKSLTRGYLARLPSEKGLGTTRIGTNIVKKGIDQLEYAIITCNAEEAVIIKVSTTLRVQHLWSLLDKVKKFTGR